MQRSQADLGVSITGYAGPGAPGEQPGLVYFGVCRRGHPCQVVMRCFEPSSRVAVRIAALETALTLLSSEMTRG
jgi:nicotinamide-nucleotide amidase